MQWELVVALAGLALLVLARRLRANALEEYALAQHARQLASEALRCTESLRGRAPRTTHHARAQRAPSSGHTSAAVASAGPSRSSRGGSSRAAASSARAASVPRPSA